MSVASAWEAAIKAQLGKLSVDAASVEDFFEEPAHVFRAAALPLHHRDPFDRLLIAQAFAEELSLVTRENFAAYGLTTSW